MDYSLPMISLSTKAKRRRRTSQEETCILEDYFSRNPNPNQREKEEIAKKVNMEPKNVHFWFQNRRAKNSKRRKLAEESAQVKHEQDTYVGYRATAAAWTAAVKRTIKAKAAGSGQSRTRTSTGTSFTAYFKHLTSATIQRRIRA
ncbi:Homeodomain-like protein [Radiomyces spectabilis]|uniref:Homeodomain-like protein n=1 Tax=Radiomyces spectabilis TaxID=64574 RepID=UPI002220DECF|nr:Homeodomain-like protein [Radiomyces spectabilis]KAI8391566.1 Homeodomain-like protein [Radiomyces spectabilis]